ncbi:tyrosinase [Coniella lustricola]|uniref:Tyrosinase n=1 Tax=Coniella lustricola TaxID=2025994 RepID=A0A2T3AAK3_9PEZI|nr:tyrosinase [Coniella lustricola]
MPSLVLSLLLGAGLVQGAAIANARPAHDSVTQSKAATSTTAATFFEGTCTAEKVTIRKEWRKMTRAEKDAYLEAEKCLFNLPANTTLDGVTTRFSDLQALHRAYQNVTQDSQFVGDIIHNVGQFLPWHRFYMHTHETLLREQCSYTGPMSWWDEEADANAGKLFQSEMWSANSFGGNGTGADLCLMDGAFANTTMHIGPGLEDSSYCLYRDQTAEFVQYMGTDKLTECKSHNDYYGFFNCMVDFNTSPHVAGHNATGGMMSDIYASAGDPMFFMHHNYIDRVWWQWQAGNSSSRLTDMSGNAYNMTTLEVNGVTLPASELNATLDYVLQVADVLPDVTIQEVMNIQGGYLCYEYDY